MNLPTVFHYFAPLIGLGTLLIGVTAVFKPKFMSKKFGIAVSGVALQYVVSTGVRDVFIGIAILILFYRQEWNVLALMFLCLGGIALSDFIAVQKHGDKKTSLVHFFGGIAVVGFGIWLLSAQS